MSRICNTCKLLPENLNSLVKQMQSMGWIGLNRATIRGADPGNVGFFPAPTTSSGVRPTRMPMSVLNSLDEHEPNHHLLELVPSRHSSAQAKIGPCTLPVPKSSSNGLQEMKCVAKLEQGPSTIVHGGELASKFEVNTSQLIHNWADVMLPLYCKVSAPHSINSCIGC